MQINLSQEIEKHFQRLNHLAEEAGNDEEESFSSRASAMSALTKILTDLTKSQESIVNMERLMKIEATTIEVLKEFLNPKQQEFFLDELETRLNVRTN